MNLFLFAFRSFTCTMRLFYFVLSIVCLCFQDCEDSAQAWPPAHLFAVRGSRKRGFYLFKIALGTRMASTKWIKVNGKSDKINKLIQREQKPTWRKELKTCSSHPWIMFSFSWLVIIWRGEGFVWNWTSKDKEMEEFWT